MQKALLRHYVNMKPSKIKCIGVPRTTFTQTQAKYTLKSYTPTISNAFDFEGDKTGRKVL